MKMPRVLVVLAGLILCSTFFVEYIHCDSLPSTTLLACESSKQLPCNRSMFLHGEITVDSNEGNSRTTPLTGSNNLVKLQKAEAGDKITKFIFKLKSSESCTRVLSARSCLEDAGPETNDPNVDVGFVMDVYVPSSTNVSVELYVTSLNGVDLWTGGVVGSLDKSSLYGNVTLQKRLPGVQSLYVIQSVVIRVTVSTSEDNNGYVSLQIHQRFDAFSPSSSTSLPSISPSHSAPTSTSPSPLAHNASSSVSPAVNVSLSPSPSNFSGSDQSSPDPSPPISYLDDKEEGSTVWLVTYILVFFVLVVVLVLVRDWYMRKLAGQPRPVTRRIVSVDSSTDEEF